MLKQLGLPRALFFKPSLWPDLVGSSFAHSRGALPPEMARDTLSRRAQRRKTIRQKALRSGNAGLLAAIRVA